MLPTHLFDCWTYITVATFGSVAMMNAYLVTNVRLHSDRQCICYDRQRMGRTAFKSEACWQLLATLLTGAEMRHLLPVLLMARLYTCFTRDCGVCSNLPLLVLSALPCPALPLLALPLPVLPCLVLPQLSALPCPTSAL